ncbi:hypothetical protein SEA_PEPPERWOOD_250 [Streptomyces phage Pepperwood]|nr:hypothetical protein SEA_PEPPERWOOD_1 [Streptomyces phage Pepperwood]WDS52003.1 hypothetical protein SEA_PEPPERWOOD_250 [Streptomyces phage Pepperwood]
MYVLCWSDESGDHWEVIESRDEIFGIVGEAEYLLFNREDAL